MSSPWGDNIFTSLVSKVSSKKKKKAAAATSDKRSSSTIQDQQGTFNGSVAAAGVQHQVQQQQKQQFLPRQRSPVPMTTPTAMSSSSTQAARSRPNSRAGADVSQLGSSLTGPSISRSGSALSLSGHSQAGSSATSAAPPRSGSSVPSGETCQFNSSSSATLPKMTSSLQSTESHCPTALRFSKADESDANNNDNYYDGTVVAESLPICDNNLESHLDNNNNNNNSDSSDSDESQEINNYNDPDETQLSLDIVQESNPMYQFNQQEQLPSNGTPPKWEDVPPDAIMAKLKSLKHEFLESKGLRPFYKSYSCWEKMTADQRDKAAAWFRRLPAHIQGLKTYSLLYFLLILILFSLYSIFLS
jgi:hypothetical protein